MNTESSGRGLPMSVRTLPQLLAWRVAATPQGDAYRQFDAASGAWASTTWSEANRQVLRWTRTLAALGLARAFPHYAQPRAVWATHEPWTVENNLMTPTLKLKRNNLAAQYAAQIETLYRH